MTLKFKAPFGPGVSLRSKRNLNFQRIRRRMQKKGMEFQRKGSGSRTIIVPPKKKPTVKTPRRTSRGISF